jgi:serralysin
MWQALVMARRDFSQDGSSDILWRRGATGDFGWWDMDHGHASWVPVGIIGTEWHLAGTGDYARDGVPDLLWNREGPVVTISGVPPNRRSTDHLAWWDMQAGGGRAYHDFFDYADDINALLGRAFFTVVRDLAAQDALDFNGDGRSDILMLRGENDRGWTSVEISLVAADGSVTQTAPNSWGWNFAAAADFTADGTSDILWRQGSYGVGLWSFRDGAPIAWTDLGSSEILPGFEVVATGDVTGDGGADAVWWNPLIRYCGLWDIEARSGSPTAQWIDIGVVPGTWSPAGVGDYTGDGTEDLLWRDAVSGEVGFWAMREGQIMGWQSLGTVPLDWQLA